MSDSKIPLSVPSIEGNEWEYVKECLDTEWVSSVGKYVTVFEDRIREYTGARHAIAVVNGTAALHLALMVTGVGPGDEVIVPTLTFIAPVNAVMYVGARPVFMDCDDYYDIDVEKTIGFIEEETLFKDGNSYSKESGRRISALIPVHIFGNAARLEELEAVCRERNIRIIEDATESLGTYYTRGKQKGRHTGTVGDIGCYSFNGNKIITTGGGGMIVTDDSGYAERCRYLSTQAKDDSLRYIHNEIGYNYRLTNIQAALGVAQLEKLPEFIERKRRNYAIYRERIEKIDGLHLAEVPDYANQNHWFYSLWIDKTAYGRDRDGLMEHLARNGIQARPVWELNHRQKMFREFRAYEIERAPELWEMTLNIPCSVNLREQDIIRVIEVL
jgi:perosamine synthetase